MVTAKSRKIPLSKFMKNRRSHELFTNAFFPFLDKKTVRQVNHCIENASYTDMMLGNAGSPLMGMNWGFLRATHEHRQADQDLYMRP